MPEDLDPAALRALGDAATGPQWIVRARHTADAIVDPYRPDAILIRQAGRDIARCVRTADAEFIAAARNNWDALLDERDELRDRVEAQGREIERLTRDIDAGFQTVRDQRDEARAEAERLRSVVADAENLHQVIHGLCPVCFAPECPSVSAPTSTDGEG